jgi:hypothetical protein
MTALVALETVVVALLTLVVAGLLRSHADILRRLHALDQGVETGAGDGFGRETLLAPPATRDRRRAPDLDGEAVHGDEFVHVAVADVAHRTLLAFLSSGCLTCRAFWESFADPETLGLPGDIRLVVVTKDRDEESPHALHELAPTGVTTIASSRAWAAYGVPGAPYFVLVDGPRGRIDGEGTGTNWSQVRNLVVHADGDGRGGDAREARIDRELLAHGIGPGDARLFAGETTT